MIKKSKNQKGFSAVELVLVIVIVALIGVVGWLVYKNHHKTTATATITSTQKKLPACGKVATADWAPCMSSNGNFTATFPSQPILSAQITSSLDGVSYTTNGVVSSTINGSYQLVYWVNYLTFPDNSTIPSLASLLAKHLSATYQDLNNISTNSATVDGNKTITYEITGIQNNVRYYETGKTLQKGKIVYRVEAVNANTQAPNAQRFINNFKVN